MATDVNLRLTPPSRAQKARDEFTAGAVQSIISAAKNDGYHAATFRAQPPRRLCSMPTEQLALVGGLPLIATDCH